MSKQREEPLSHVFALPGVSRGRSWLPWQAYCLDIVLGSSLAQRNDLPPELKVAAESTVSDTFSLRKSIRFLFILGHIG